LKIEREDLENRQVEITVELDDDRLARAMRATAKRISRSTKIAGFRPGKAPYDLLLRKFGEDVIFDEALEELGQELYREAIDEMEIEPFAPGTLDEVVDRDPLILRYTVPLSPEVDLGSYKDLRHPYEEPKIEDEAVEQLMENLRERQALIEPADRPAALGDVVVADVKADLDKADLDEADLDEADLDEADLDEADLDEADLDEADLDEADLDEADLDEADLDEADLGEADLGEADLDEADLDVEQESENQFLLDDKDVSILLNEETTWPIPGISEHLVGIEAGDKKKFEYTFPEDYVNETLREKHVTFEITCLEVKSRFVPEWTDDLAKSLGEYESLLDLRIKVREDLTNEAINQAETIHGREVVDKVVEGATVSYPPILLQQEINDMLRELSDRLRMQNLSLEDYMKIDNKTQEDLIQEVEPSAKERLQRALILGELITVENIEVDDAEVDAEIENFMERFEDKSDKTRQLFDNPEGRRRISLDLLSDKAIKRLIAIAVGEGDQPGETEVEPEEIGEGDQPGETEVEPEEVGEGDQPGETEVEPEEVGEGDQRIGSGRTRTGS